MTEHKDGKHMPWTDPFRSEMYYMRNKAAIDEALPGANASAELTSGALLVELYPCKDILQHKNYRETS